MRIRRKAKSYKLTTKHLRRAVVVFLRMAAEKDGNGTKDESAFDRDARAAAHDLEDTDETLRKVVNALLQHDDDRKRLVGVARTAACVEVILEELKASGDSRERKGPEGAARLRGIIIEAAKAFDLEWKGAAVNRMVGEATKARHLRGMKGLQAALLDTVPGGVGLRRTLEGLLSARKGKPQRQGKVKRPAHAHQLPMLDDSSLRLPIKYALTVLLKPFSRRVRQAMVEAFDRALLAGAPFAGLRGQVVPRRLRALTR